MVTINKDVLAKEKVVVAPEPIEKSEQIFDNDMIKQTTNEGIKENRKTLNLSELREKQQKNY